MKKLFALCLIFTALIVVTQAQNKAVNLQAKTYNEMTLTAVDTFTNLTSYYIQYELNNNNPVNYDVQTKIAKVSGTVTTTPVVLYGKKFSGDAWTTITTVTWKNTTADTTITYSINSTSPVYYRYLRLGYAVTTTGKAKVVNAKCKVWPR